MATETPVPTRAAAHDDAPVASPARAGGEVDLGAGLRAAGRLWWIVLLAVVVGAAIALAATRGAKATFEASATVYAGQPVSPNGVLLNTIGSKAATAIETAKGDDAVKAGATAAGVAPARIRGDLSVTAIVSPLASKLQNPPALLKVTIRDRSQHVAQAAADALAAQLVKDTNTYTPGKVRDLTEEVAAYKSSLQLLDQQKAQALAAAKAATGSEAASFAILATSLGREYELTRADLASAQGALGLAGELETSRIITQPNAVRVSSTARKPTVVMGAFVGLLVGLLLAWSLGRRRGAAA